MTEPDRLEHIKQGLNQNRQRDDWGGYFLTVEGELSWPGSHVDWLIAEIERLRAELEAADKELSEVDRW